MSDATDRRSETTLGTGTNPQESPVEIVFDLDMACEKIIGNIYFSGYPYNKPYIFQIIDNDFKGLGQVVHIYYHSDEAVMVINPLSFGVSDRPEPLVTGEFGEDVPTMKYLRALFKSDDTTSGPYDISEMI
jgi:hypothetical protein